MINRDIFFPGLRKLFGPFDAVQVKVLNAVLDEWEARQFSDLRWLAYIIATGWGECHWRPIEEIGRGRGKPYGKKDATTGKTYYGRGCPTQITWKRNYAAVGKVLGIDLVNRPELALDIATGVKIGFEGMTRGIFTGRKLADYFNEHSTGDARGARKIINGTDKAAQFAEWHDQIIFVLRKALVEGDLPTADVVAHAEQVEAKPLPEPVQPVPPSVPPDAPQGRAGTFIIFVLAALAAIAGAVTIIGSIWKGN